MCGRDFEGVGCRAITNKLVVVVIKVFYLHWGVFAQ